MFGDFFNAFVVFLVIFAMISSIVILIQNQLKKLVEYLLINKEDRDVQSTKPQENRWFRPGNSGK